MFMKTKPDSTAYGNIRVDANGASGGVAEGKGEKKAEGRRGTDSR